MLDVRGRYRNNHAVPGNTNEEKRPRHRPKQSVWREQGLRDLFMVYL